MISLIPSAQAEAGVFELEGHTGGAAAPRLADPDHVALVLHTSGTTSRPKMVPLTHANLLASADSVRTALTLSENDRCLNVMPLFHIHGLVGAVLSSLAAGGSVFCAPGFIAPKFFEWMEEARPTWYTAVPTMHQAILARAASNREVIDGGCLRLIRSSSAALPTQVMAALEATFAAPVIEAYGMTEASHQMASNPLPPRQRKPGSVGVAAGPEIAIMDQAGSLLPPGQSGEVVIRGPNVTRGYEHNPEANRSSFTNGWFRTGDQGFLDTDGYLFITGRLKEIINRGGEKVSPREVDEVLMDHPDVLQAVTFAIPDPKLGEDVAAAVVLREQGLTTEKELRRFAATRLADFKVPRRVVMLDDIPKGPTGKLQRIGLAEKLGLTGSEQASPNMEAEYVPPRTELERKLAKIWADLLGLDRVGVHDDFFQLGGDSILAAMLISRVRESRDAELSLIDFFDDPTVAGIANAVQTAGRVGRFPPIHPVSGAGELPLSYAQQRFWFLEQLDPHTPAYNRTFLIRLRGSLDAAALQQALGEIVRRHQALRTCFPSAGGEPVQTICDPLPVALPVIRISQLAEGEREAQARRLADQVTAEPFDLATGPLLRAALLQLGEADHVLVIVMHHVISDGWSMGVFFQELAALYGAFSAGRPSPLPELPVQYSDFACWQRRLIEEGLLESQLSYWKQQLAGLRPLLELPADRPRPAFQGYQGATCSLTLPKALSEELKALGREAWVTLFMLLLAAFKVQVCRYTGDEDIAVGSPIAYRNSAEMEGLIGFIVNTLVLRTDLSGNPTFRELLARVRITALGAYAHQDLPFEKLVEELRPERSLGHTPLYQLMFHFKNIPRRLEEIPGLKIEQWQFDRGVAQADLALEVMETPGGLLCSLEYNIDLFNRDRIERMLGHFQTLLEGIVADPLQPIWRLPLLTEAERRQLLVEWNQTRQEYPSDLCVHQLFEDQVERTPEAAAVAFESSELTYRELNRRANQLAHFLRKVGVGPETLVGISADRSLEMVVGILGTLKAGGAYLPLDPSYPEERLAFMLADARVPVLLTQERLLETLPRHQTKAICLDRDWEKIAREQEANPPNLATSSNLAYVIYTSGSTGRPKGIAMSHRPLCNLVSWQIRNSVSTAPRTLQFSSPGFDVSFQEIFSTLCPGGTLFLLSKDQWREPQWLFRRLEATGAERVFLTPTSLQHFAEVADDQTPSSRLSGHLRQAGYSN